MYTLFALQNARVVQRRHIHPADVYPGKRSRAGPLQSKFYCDRKAEVSHFPMPSSRPCLLALFAAQVTTAFVAMDVAGLVRMRTLRRIGILDTDRSATFQSHLRTEYYVK